MSSPSFISFFIHFESAFFSDQYKTDWLYSTYSLGLKILKKKNFVIKTEYFALTGIKSYLSAVYQI